MENTQLQLIIWSLPILFMLHDLEEIIIVKPWQIKYRTKLSHAKLKPFNHFKLPESGAVAILIEFIILTIVALLASLYQTYLLWFAVDFVFIFHFFGHYVLSLVFKGYVPGLYTAIILLPLCLINIISFSSLLTPSWVKVIAICLITLLIFVLFFKALTKSITIFDKLLQYYSQKE
ncbi:HXXEE domain-containing protein [Tetragenococcus koreensis]|uniref:HXXEE domain-containing protein n=1 Tax=Tetragenococcus koreensis TaxID=290335 RepID=UPI001F3BCDB4|nr:HXXEE domain-containing protein [Tetragenococcus koreensis]MCF1616505.1 HXXEE domain-containing protein [Tetragenococcus koreensis]MCF1621437.1 HXXEE domain-containing protein [Tetragenococcus koreensis]MCF1626963.1 HXXEE domain-containing protein [Tetragenococcus koreensis]MCF1677550.1 HXXEE domain-containing protein [Tetragenococcus koreensis]MCF1679952.1 HXXEE domain-containing protein [Tetragenococcus koreensis]